LQIDGHEELIHELANRFFDLVPEEGWRRIDLCGTPERHELTVLMDDRSRPAVTVPDQVGVILGKLRALVRDPAKGEWRTTRITMTAPGRMTYNYDFGRTSPNQPFGPVEEHEALLDFTTSMVQTLPTEWEQLFITFRSVGGYVEIPAQIVTVFGGSGHLRLPDSAVEFFLDQKRNMHKPGKAAWTSLRYHLIRHSSRYTAEYDWDNEPDWDNVPPAELFARELELFPRDEDRVAAWLRRRLETTP